MVKSVAGRAEGNTNGPALIACAHHSASSGSGAASVWMYSRSTEASAASATAERLRRTPGMMWSSPTIAVVRAGGSSGKYSFQTSLNS